MLGDVKAYSGFAVKDTAKAAKYYRETLGLDVAEEEMGLLALKLAGGGQPVMVYSKPDHVPAVFTILNFPVADINASVDELAARGITFERYDGFDQDDKGIAPDDEGKPFIAWFTDPDGNIFAVHEER